MDTNKNNWAEEIAKYDNERSKEARNNRRAITELRHLTKGYTDGGENQTQTVNSLGDNPLPAEIEFLRKVLHDAGR